jgi:protein-S-isoprenylcysteine O-methyltransferase Ste14
MAPSIIGMQSIIATRSVEIFLMVVDRCVVKHIFNFSAKVQQNFDICKFICCECLRTSIIICNFADGFEKLRTMKTFREIIGYVLGGVLFVALLPTIMWLASGMPALAHIGAYRAAITGMLIMGGLTLSVWTIVYMKRQGKGNPMDAFDHEIGPRTQHLMTDGPYRLNRNPMLTGTFLYLSGFIVWLWTWQSLLVWLIFVAIMIVQVRSEEKRLLRDFGEEYDAYCKRTGRFLPFTWNK